MSDDLGEKQRPNAKYKLSRDKVPDSADGLTFYYNRERRLENAPDSVKELYREGKPVKFGLIHSLVADKPRRILFAIIIIMCLAILVLSIFGYFDSSYLLDKNKIEITAAAFEGTTIIILKKTTRSQNAYTGAVDIAVSPEVPPGEEQYPVFTHRVFFTLNNEEVYRFAVPFDTPDLVMVLQTEKNALHIKFKSE